MQETSSSASFISSPLLNGEVSVGNKRVVFEHPHESIRKWEHPLIFSLRENVFQAQLYPWTLTYASRVRVSLDLE